MTPPARLRRRGEFPTAPRPWLTSGQVAKQLRVSPQTVARWAKQGRLAHRRTPGGHRRYDPDLIDQLVRDLTAPALSGPPICSSGRSLIVSRRTTWLIDMGDGTWAVCCMACRIGLFRGPQVGAARAARDHSCEPVIPLGRRRRPGGGR